jgi:hypothetical protein
MLLVAVFLLLFQRKAGKKSAPELEPVVSSVVVDPSSQISVDEEGRRYRLVVHSATVPRKTYLRGALKGKCWSEPMSEEEGAYKQVKFYRFHIYEAQVSLDKESDISSVPFPFPEDADFPRERLASTIPCIVSLGGEQREYAVTLHEPKIRSVRFDRKLHQLESDGTFGTIEAEITGCILDFVDEERVEREYLKETPVPEPPTERLRKTGVPTGNIEYRNNYKHIEYYYSDYKTTYWGKWEYVGAGGPAGDDVGTLVGILLILGLLLILPRLAIILGLILLAVLISLIPARVWKGLMWLFAGGVALVFLISLLNLERTPVRTPIPRVAATDRPEERHPEYQPLEDQGDTAKADRDTLITYFRSWEDYSGQTYEGRFWVRKSTYDAAHRYKQRLPEPANTPEGYDKVIFLLKEHDKLHLIGLYQMFDSIRAVQDLSREGFAEMIVSFVQDIPYTLILPDDCNPALYNDRNIREFLSNPGARCGGNEKYGINSPVEFMATLQGDCDTRTLLLYTLLAHYEYDVVLLSSEVYNHSLIGINLSYSGNAFPLGNQRYVFWETTAPGARPGMLPKEISDVRHWRVSLKSKI